MANTQHREDFLSQNVFYGLTDVNDGFDTPGINYFSAADFDIVLHRVANLGIGVYGIEPWEGSEFFAVKTFEDFTDDPTDPKWFFQAFNEFRELGRDLQYSATYCVPETD